MVIRREPTPIGPITDFFDRLHELHLDAGEPGVRQIATGLGRGVLSHTTVHSVFRGPRVPKWGHVELIIEHLGGDVGTFRALWRAARLAERDPGPAAPPERTDTNNGTDPGLFDFVMVTYRSPVRRESGTLSGLSTVDSVLDDVVEARQGSWVGWSDGGDPGHQGNPIRLVHLATDEFDGFYNGYSNSTIWPLYHGAIERPEFRREWRATYRLVNERYAGAVADIANRGATVWIHDYLLQQVPALLRRRRPDLRIGFFLHIPFPPVEVFRQLPGREEILTGLLGADLIGFQQQLSVWNFLRLVRQLLGLTTDANSVYVDGRRVTVECLPISVDVPALERAAAEPAIQRRSAAIRAELGDPTSLIVGLDRLDYTKGIDQRLLAYGQILADGLADSVAFVQVGRLTRENSAKYAQLRERVERLAGRLNGEYGTIGRQVVHYTNRAMDFAEKIALYRAADIMLVTPLSDGMNLVAKEYVASRTDNRGVLVLSEFAGAAAELTDALLVNPNDLDDLGNAIVRAVRMSPVEQARRMEAMRGHLRSHDIQAWISGFLTGLDKAAGTSPENE